MNNRSDPSALSVLNANEAIGSNEEHMLLMNLQSRYGLANDLPDLVSTPQSIKDWVNCSWVIALTLANDPFNCLLVTPRSAGNCDPEDLACRLAVLDADPKAAGLELDFR